MGTFRQLRPMRSSPLLQQAIFWPLPQTAASSLLEAEISVLWSEAPWATATAATEAMTRVLKKAIVMVGELLKARVGSWSRLLD